MHLCDSVCVSDCILWIAVNNRPVLGGTKRIMTAMNAGWFVSTALHGFVSELTAVTTCVQTCLISHEIWAKMIQFFLNN